MNVYWIIGLALTIPLAILANLLTPIVRNKLALLSSSMTARRIRVLEKELDAMKKRDFIAEIFRQFYLLFGALTMILFGLSTYMLSFGNDPNPKTWQFLAYMVFGIGLIMTSTGSRRAGLMMHSDKYIKNLEKAIAKLKTKQQERSAS